MLLKVVALLMPVRISVLLYLMLCLHAARGQNVYFCGNDDNAAFICEDGRLLITGENNTGQLGTGSFVPSNIPIPVGGIDGAGTAPRCKQVQIEGVSTFLALTNSGDTVLAWGPNNFGQAGDGTLEVKVFPVRVRGVEGNGYLQNIRQIATGNFTGYALTEDGKVLSWGSNSHGQTGTGEPDSIVYFPSYVLKAPGDTLKNVTAISAGGTFCMALLCDGTVWAWGRNNVFQLGQNNTANSSFAIPVKRSNGTGILSNIKKIEAGDNCAFALSAADTLWGWGPNWDGRVGTGSGNDHPLPAYIRNPSGNAKLSGVEHIASGQGHTVVILADQRVFAWGRNDYGQLGRNDTINSFLPVQVRDPAGTGFLSGVNYVGAGDEFTIVRTTDNALYVWGANTLGQLGVNDHVHRKLPFPLEISCQPVPDMYPATGTMEHAPAICAGNNSGSVYLTRHQFPIVDWQQSFDGFASYSSLGGKDFSQYYHNLQHTTYYRAVMKGCDQMIFSPVAVLEIDSLSRGGTIESSATVRVNNNHDTLHLTSYKGSILHWESSTDNFTSVRQQIAQTDSVLAFTDLSQTTYYRALVQLGACPAVYSDTAEIRTIDQAAIKIYNGFTPDGDHINDEWIIDFIELFPRNRVEIYNRWGQPVYRASPYDNNANVWRGENNQNGNEPLPDGTYFYVVDPGEGFQVLKGFVVISR